MFSLFFLFFFNMLVSIHFISLSGEQCPVAAPPFHNILSQVTSAFSRRPPVRRLRLDRKLPRHDNIVQALAHCGAILALQDNLLVALARLHRDARHGVEGVRPADAALPRLARRAGRESAATAAPERAAPAVFLRAAAAQRVAPVAVPCRVARRAEEGAQADLFGALPDKRVDDEEVRDDDGDKGLATRPLAPDGCAFGSGLEGCVSIVPPALG